MVEFETGINEYIGQNFIDLSFPKEEVSSKKEISGKEFDGCTFEACDFSEATFRRCKFADCRFIKCNLSVVKIGYSKFADVTFEDCKVIGVDWTKGLWPGLVLGSPIEFRRCVIDASSFYGMSLKNIVVEECNAHDVDFREADISHSNFSYTDLSNSLFSNTNLTEANFLEATNYNIDVNHNVIKKAKFCRLEALRLLESLGIELVG